MQMKKARINISHSRFILFKLKIFGEIVTTLNNCLSILYAIKLFCVDALCFLSQIRLDINLSYIVPNHALTPCFPSKPDSC